MPFRFEAPILSRMRSEVTSRSNWAKERPEAHPMPAHDCLRANNVESASHVGLQPIQQNKYDLVDSRQQKARRRFAA
jgi:hypothetical protein